MPACVPLSLDSCPQRCSPARCIALVFASSRSGSSRTSFRLGAAAAEGPYARIAIMRPHRRRHGRLRSRRTSGTSSGTSRPGHRGSGMDGPSGPANGSGGSSTPRSGTRPPASTTRWLRRRTSGTTSCNVTPHVESLGERALRVPARVSRAAPVSRHRAPGSSSRPWNSTPGRDSAFEAALGAGQSTLQGETLWYRMVAGGSAPRYVRTASAPQPVGDSRREQRTGATRSRQRVDREDDGRDPESAADDELRPSAASLMTTRTLERFSVFMSCRCRGPRGRRSAIGVSAERQEVLKLLLHRRS